MNQTTQDPAHTPACDDQENEDTLDGMRVFVYVVLVFGLFNISGVLALIAHLIGGTR